MNTSQKTNKFCSQPNLNSKAVLGERTISQIEGPQWQEYLQNSNDTASGASASISSFLRVGVVGLAEVVNASVQNNGAADDAARSE